MSACEFDCLRDVDLFADLSVQDLEAVERQIRTRTYARGESVVWQGQSVQSLFVVRRGRVRVFRRTESGRELTITILGQGTVFGEMALLGQHFGDNGAEVIDDAEICVIDTDCLRQLLLADSRIALRIVMLLGERVARLEDRLADASFRPLVARVSAALVAAGERRRDGRVVVRLTHLQLADLMGVTRESVSRVLGDLAARDLVSLGRGRVVVPDDGRLIAYSRSIEMEWSE
ncbi:MULTISPECIES: Crp/Fnr family transcriptional regulator [Microbacterium]|uniref:Crp/Fnr family transcriptional regulator n=1 Tax=Microbacterium TaxID=33882 RepID=UPI0013DF5A43|nr:MULTISPECIES: Crp/Fnr family transcriptional regulator [Microbacterium]